MTEENVREEETGAPTPDPVLIRPEDLEDNGRRYAGTLSRQELERPGGVELQAGPVAFGVWADREADAIVLRGWFGVDLRTVCDRCLEAIGLTVDRDIDLSFRPATAAPRQEEAELDDSDLDTDYYAGEGVDLRSVFAEQILLALPMKLLCSDDCQGLCPQCGADLNDDPCDCEPPVDPRLAQLAELRDKL